MTTKDRVLGMMKRASAAKAFYGKVMQKRAEHAKLAAAQRLYGKVMQKRAGIAKAKHLNECYMAGFGKAARSAGIDPAVLLESSFPSNF